MSNGGDQRRVVLFEQNRDCQRSASPGIQGATQVPANPVGGGVSHTGAGLPDGQGGISQLVGGGVGGLGGEHFFGSGGGGQHHPAGLGGVYSHDEQRGGANALIAQDGGRQRHLQGGGDQRGIGRVARVKQGADRIGEVRGLRAGLGGQAQLGGGEEGQAIHELQKAGGAQGAGQGNGGGGAAAGNAGAPG